MKIKTKPKPPRDMETIKKFLSQTLFDLGNAQYQLHLREKEVAELTQTTYELNLEGSRRLELDKTNEPKEGTNE